MMQKIKIFMVLFLTSFGAFSQNNQTILANSDNANFYISQPYDRMLIRGEFLGSINIFSLQVNAINPEHWSDSLSQCRIAEIFKIYYYSKPKDNNKSTLKIHANANNGKVYLGLAADIIDEIRVIDQSGRIIYTKYAANNSYESIDFVNFPRGIYYLQVSGNKEFSTKQLIKK